LASNLPTAGTLKITHLIDDGAVFYLNGLEFFRFNMPDGPVTQTTPALGQISTATCLVTNIGVTNLLSGDNVLAVEVHQFGSAGSDLDVVFGTSIDYDYQPTSPLPPRLAIARTDSSDQVVSWNNVANLNWGLEFTTNLPGISTDWQALPNASPYTNFNPGPVFFRVHVR